MEWNSAIWLYPRFWVRLMPMREPLAAVLRLTRTAQGLSQETFHGRVEARHISNIENAKSSPTLATLEELASALGIDLVAILAAASAFEKGLDLKEYLRYLAAEAGRLESLGVLEKIDGEFEAGKLVTAHPRVRSSSLNKTAVLKCRATGMTQKETVEALGLGKATVSRIWNSVDVP